MIVNISVKEKYSTEYVECYCEYSICSGYDVHPGSETRQLSLEGTFSDLSPPSLFKFFQFIYLFIYLLSKMDSCLRLKVKIS